MLQLELKPVEFFDSDSNAFFFAFPWAKNSPVPENQVMKIQLEHSLLSLSRWEEKWKVPFLVDKPEKTIEQTLDYIRFMTITKNVPDGVYETFTQDQIDTITQYIQDSHTATWFSERGNGKGPNGSHQIITAEIIYYWMIVSNIPWDPAERWHLNKLLTLIRVCSIENSPKKKQSKAEIADEYRRIKAARRAAKK